MREFLYPEEDSIAETSVKTLLNSAILSWQRRFYNFLKSTFILAERDLGFSFATFQDGRSSEATEDWTKFP